MSNLITTATQIVEGHFNNVLDKAGLLPEDMQALAGARMRACTSCHTTPTPQGAPTGPGLRGDNCNSCSCYMPAKTKVLNAKCPIGRW